MCCPLLPFFQGRSPGREIVKKSVSIICICVSCILHVSLQFYLWTKMWLMSDVLRIFTLSRGHRWFNFATARTTTHVFIIHSRLYFLRSSFVYTEIACLLPVSFLVIVYVYWILDLCKLVTFVENYLVILKNEENRLQVFGLIFFLLNRFFFCH